MKFFYRLPQQKVIYQASWGKTSGQLLIKKPVSLPLKPLRLLGKGLVIFSAAILILTLSPLIAAEVRYKTSQVAQKFGFGPQEVVESQFGFLLNQKLIPPLEQRFQLIIPKLKINSPIIPNIDPNNKKEYVQALKQGIAHASGSGLPGEKKSNQTIYLFAHSTDSPGNIGQYNAIFYLLKELEENDRIIIWFWGQKFVYQVWQKETLNPTDTHYFEPQNKEEILVLQTCWPPGTTLKQLVVLAKPLI